MEDKMLIWAHPAHQITDIFCSTLHQAFLFMVDKILYQSLFSCIKTHPNDLKLPTTADHQLNIKIVTILSSIKTHPNNIKLPKSADHQLNIKIL